MKSLFDATGVTVTTKFEPSLPNISADEEQLWQAILNLVRNAIEAMPKGGTLTVSTARDGDHVVLRISDTGNGIAEAERSHIFKPFFSTKSGGTGLGLPLTQQIIIEHDGGIECESDPDTGTTFIIRLPLATED
jgi:signal transduction histidine kinase